MVNCYRKVFKDNNKIMHFPPSCNIIYTIGHKFNKTVNPNHEQTQIFQVSVCNVLDTITAKMQSRFLFIAVILGQKNAIK